MTDAGRLVGRLRHQHPANHVRTVFAFAGLLVVIICDLLHPALPRMGGHPGAQRRALLEGTQRAPQSLIERVALGDDQAVAAETMPDMTVVLQELAITVFPKRAAAIR